MTGKRIIITSAAGVLLSLTGIMAYLFLWGKLFPFSPVIIGFDRHELANVIVYVQRGAVYNRFGEIAAWIPAVERFHELKFTNKPKIFIFRDRKNYLQRSTSKARFCAYSSGSLIVSPWALREAEEGKISLEIYIKHELSHILLFQHKGFLAEFRYPNWLLEGIAVYSANQMGTSFYPDKEQTLRDIKRGNFLPPRLFHTRKEDDFTLDVPNRIAFIYSEFACIVDYLVSTRGKEKFLAYMKGLFASADPDQVFRKVYGITFDDMILNFRDSIGDAP
jgi:predicted SprT family Zn-dependent metalloprotease